MKIKIFILTVLFITLLSYSKTVLKRSRGEGYYRCENANVIGAGNLWVKIGGEGFIWDSDESGGTPGIYPFPEVMLNVGLFDKASISLESRALSYGKKFGSVALGAKYSIFDNKNINLHNLGFLLKFNYNVLPEFHSSIAGYQDSQGTGFTPEGFTVHGSQLIIKALYDIDIIARVSKIPIKISTNLGAKIHLNSDFINYSEYLISLGISYSGASADFFIEYSLDAFFNNSTKPKLFNETWTKSGWEIPKIWEVAFTENPMYVTFGGRIRYPGGIVIYGAVPLLISQNVGSDITYKTTSKIHKDFPDEKARGIKDSFDPWYAKWKIVLSLSYPIRYRGTSSELKRVFLLKKNRKGKKKIDIDEQLNSLTDTKTSEEDDRKKRLEEIKKRRLEIQGEQE